MAEGVGQSLQHADRLFRDFRTDAIAGKDCETQEHDGNSGILNCVIEDHSIG
jgi:hypothetical protein